jgi:hypothetical protein
MPRLITPAEGKEIIDLIYGSVLLLEQYPNVMRSILGELASKATFGEYSSLDRRQSQLSWNVLTGAAYNIIVTPFETYKRKLDDYNIHNSSQAAAKLFDLDFDNFVNQYKVVVMTNTKGSLMSNLRHAIAHCNVFPTSLNDVHTQISFINRPEKEVTFHIIMDMDSFFRFLLDLFVDVESKLT